MEARTMEIELTDGSRICLRWGAEDVAVGLLQPHAAHHGHELQWAGDSILTGDHCAVLRELVLTPVDFASPFLEEELFSLDIPFRGNRVLWWFWEPNGLAVELFPRRTTPQGRYPLLGSILLAGENLAALQRRFTGLNPSAETPCTCWGCTILYPSRRGHSL